MAASDLKTESVSRTEEIVSPRFVAPQRRVTILERPEIVEGLPAAVIGAIQREMVEMRIEFEKKLEEYDDRSRIHVRDLLRLAGAERLDLERLRLENQQSSQWETESSAKTP